MVAEQVTHTTHEINMGVLHITRIHDIIVEIEKLNTMVIMSGQPTQAIELRLMINWYGELSGVLKAPEIKEAQRFLEHFRNNPIINTGNALLFKAETEDKMFEFKLWLFNMMYKKKLLTRIGVEYGHTEY